MSHECTQSMECGVGTLRGVFLKKTDVQQVIKTTAGKLLLETYASNAGKRRAGRPFVRRSAASACLGQVDRAR